MNLNTLQDRIGYRFRDRTLLTQALTHSSYANEHPDEGPDNQRLEFLGDAVLNLTVAFWIFERYPSFEEGEMTRLRSSLVREETLAHFARQLGLGDLIRLGRGEGESGGRRRAPILEDAFEALIGALYLDGGDGPVRRLLHPLLEPMADLVLTTKADKDPKSILQEWAQAELGVTPSYRVISESGPEHAKTFRAEVLLGQRVAGQGEGHSKQDAERAAALEALRDVEPERGRKK